MSRVNYTKDDYNAMARDRVRAFAQIATRLGELHPITRMMGSLAWGRHNAEQGPGGTLRTAVREMSFLDGYFDALNTWASVNDTKAQRVMLDVYPRGLRKAGERL